MKYIQVNNKNIFYNIVKYVYSFHKHKIHSNYQDIRTIPTFNIKSYIDLLENLKKITFLYGKNRFGSERAYKHL